MASKTQKKVRRLSESLLILMMGTITGFILGWLVGCTPEREPCTPPAMECRGLEAWYCTSDGEWVMENDCGDQMTFDGERVEDECCLIGGEAVCLEVCDD